MAGERKSARDLSAEFSQTARRQHEPSETPPAGTQETTLGLASAAVTDADEDFPTGQPYARLYVSWEAADRLDREHRALRRRVRGRVSKLQLLDALISVALRHPEEVLTDLRQRTQHRGLLHEQVTGWVRQPELPVCG
jgi:hypothetical protein